jgi:hypothetical protein
MGGIAIVKASLSTDDAGATCREALAFTYQMRSWTIVRGLLTLATTCLYDHGNREAACVLLGHPEVHGAAPLANVMAWGLKVEALEQEPAAATWKARGAAMDRHELVRYALDQLGPA